MGIFAASLILLACLALAAFFSAAETALLRLREHELEEEIQAQKGPAALAIRDLLSSTSRLLVTILLGNNIANILAASVASAVAVDLLGVDAGVLVSAIVMTIVVFLAGEVFPKAVAAHHPRGTSTFVAIPLYLIHQSLRPLHILFDRFIDPAVERMVGGRASAGVPTTTEEILRLARQTQRGEPASAQTGSLAAIIGAAAGASQMTVRDIMISRAEVTGFPIETPATAILDGMLEERYTRVPVYEGSIDHILGVVHLKDLVKLVQEGGTDVRGILKNVLRVPERKPILPLLADMQHAFVHMAIVKDEFNVTLGIVTQEDILEELVGEIRDEFDREELLTIRRLGEDHYEALGRVKVLDFNRETGWSLHAERGDTLAGLVFNELGRAPRRWESVRVPGYEIVVVDISGSRITQVRIRRIDEEDVEERTEA
ncbi:MAG TPA: hemolysin family protein [Candidatus Limnocylindrales bacterium]|nr:hemolysin family protein [Candidatus Limnocylindrales bacterium]